MNKKTYNSQEKICCIVAKHGLSENIILHLLCVYFKHRKVTICPTIAELRLPVPQPPPH